MWCLATSNLDCWKGFHPRASPTLSIAFSSYAIDYTMGKHRYRGMSTIHFIGWIASAHRRFGLTIKQVQYRPGVIFRLVPQRSPYRLLRITNTQECLDCPIVGHWGNHPSSSSIWNSVYPTVVQVQNPKYWICLFIYLYVSTFLSIHRYR